MISMKGIQIEISQAQRQGRISQAPTSCIRGSCSQVLRIPPAKIHLAPGPIQRLKPLRRTLAANPAWARKNEFRIEEELGCKGAATIAGLMPRIGEKAGKPIYEARQPGTEITRSPFLTTAKHVTKRKKAWVGAVLCCKSLCTPFPTLLPGHSVSTMNTKLKLLLLAVGLGHFSILAHANCDPCNRPNPPPDCDDPPPPDPGDSMPLGIVVDDMSTAIFAEEAISASSSESLLVKD